MNNAPAILRTIITFAVIVPLAIFLGVLLTNPADYSTYLVFGILAFALVFPLLMRWHYPWLLFCWHGSITLFFLKASPDSWTVMVIISLGIAVVERILRPEQGFIRVPSITWPLICMAAVVMATAKLTGGFGLRQFGGDVYGGRKYISLLWGIAGYFALTARHIPQEKAKRYVALFFLSPLIFIISDLYPIAPGWMNPIFAVIHPNIYNFDAGSFQVGVTRMVGIGLAGSAIQWWMLATFGVRGILLSNKTWRPVLLVVACGMMAMGGFRSSLLEFGTVFTVLFFMEGLHRTKLMPVMVMTGMLAAALAVPFASKLPFTLQRMMAFLPINITSEARQDAEASTNWRVEMWKALLPQIPQHLLLGEGYAISHEDFQSMGDSAFHAIDPSQQALALSFDYHNGPLSVILPFGIWGCIVLLWFMGAGLRVMYRNYLHGDPELRTINAFLWVNFAYACFKFLFLGGGFASDVAIFTGVLGLGIALNGGVGRFTPQQPVAEKEEPYPARISSHRRPVLHR